MEIDKCQLKENKIVNAKNEKYIHNERNGEKKTKRRDLSKNKIK